MHMDRTTDNTTKGWTTRISRRRALQLGAGGGAAALASMFDARRAAAQTKPDAELIIAMSSDPGHLDPRVEAGTPGFALLSHIHDAAVWRDERTNPIPWLVTKWEQPAANVLRWHLRKGVKFHNGEDFTAEAIKVTYESNAAPNSKAPWRARIAIIKEYRIRDTYTIDLVTEKPNRPLLRNTTSCQVMSPRAMKELGEKIATNPVGTGAYKFVEYRPGQHLVMEANSGWWGPKPAIKRLRVRFIPENGTRMAALEAGEVMVVNNVPPDQISRLRANPNLRVIISPTNRVIFIALRTDRKPFNDKRVRQALNYAIDREALSKGIMGGLAPIAKAPLPESVFGAHPSLPPYQYDPERAKKLLVEAGAAGAPFSLGVPNGRYLLDKQVGEAIAGYLEAVGLQVKFENPLWSSFVNEVTKYERSKYDGFMFGWGVTTGEPDQLMGDHFHSTAVKRTLYANPEVDRLINEARENFDEARVRAAYLRAQEIVWDECPWIWLLEQPDINAVNKRLKWAAGRRDEYLLFHDATLGA
jgi:peptide/nickel transport system substrate-binding protein